MTKFLIPLALVAGLTATACTSNDAAETGDTSAEAAVTEFTLAVEGMT